MKRLFSHHVWTLVLFFLLPMGVLADTGAGTPGARIENPLRGINNLNQLIGKILDVVVMLGTYVAVIFIIWSGFLFVKAQGNEAELSKAKTTFFYTLIGVAILIGAEAIQRALSGTIGNLLR